eukprot:TRINITY_DN2013_c0_g1_i1.p1 TRINITY_DN2013_c0_g1~~TRINITY_DN2013_c0_g1_i1.p1  ORF type:complete len:547 (+),score=83.74 TRINITY_DN2013_c0_g1_i1:19-1659(+)
MSSLSEYLDRHSLSCVKIQGKGLSVISAAHFPTGHSIISAEPFCCVLQKAQLSTRCHSCFKEPQSDAPLLRCSRCKLCRYCSKQCQQKHWTLEHREECPHLCRIHPKVPPESILLMSRFCRRFRQLYRSSLQHQAQGSHEHQGASNTNSFAGLESGLSSIALLDLILGLQTHVKEFSPDRWAQFAQMAVLVRDLLGFPLSAAADESVRYLSPVESLTAPQLALASDCPPVDRIVEGFCMFLCNNFNISDEEMRTVGIGLYPQIALMNHSCEPNCVAVFDGTTVSVRALKDIQQGQELTLSYIEIAQTTAERKAHLAENFFFSCSCSRCQSPLDAYLTGWACPTVRITNGQSEKNCMGILIDANQNHGASKPLSTNQIVLNSVDMDDSESTISPDSVCCTICKKMTDYSQCATALTEFRILVNSASEKSGSNSKDAAISIYRKALSIARPILHFANAELLRCLVDYQTISLDVQKFEDAFDASQLVLQVYKRIYPSVWPILGLQYFMVGKLAWYLHNNNPGANFCLLNHDISFLHCFQSTRLFFPLL